MANLNLQENHLKQESFLRSFFIDQKPYWRQYRYELILQHIRNALSDQGLHPDYIHQHISSPANQLQDKTLKTYEVLYSDGFKSPHEQYAALISCFRQALSTEQYQQIYLKMLQSGMQNSADYVCAMLLQELSLAFFTKISLHDFCAKLVHKMAEAGATETATVNLQGPFTERPFPSEFQQVYKAIHAAPSSLKTSKVKRYLQALRGQMNFNYDPHLQENTPYLLHELLLSQPDGTTKKVLSLRLGTPTVENIFASLKQEARVTPEFNAFLQTYTLANKQHLYINLQNRVQRFHGFTEASRCLAIESLCREFPNTILIITLAKNSEFYWQERRFRNIRQAIIFKELFKRQLSEADSGFFFSPSFRQDAYFPFDQVIDQLLDYTHTMFFDNSETLHHQERLDFIEIFYTLLIEYCLEATQVDSFNISCRDGIDRAGGANSLLYFYRLIKSGAHSDIHQLQYLKTVLFAPAILVKKRTVSLHRFERFISAAERISKALS